VDKTTLISLIMRIAEIIGGNCDTREQLEQVRVGVEKYIDFLESIFQS